MVVESVRGEKISRVTLFHGRFVASTIRFPSLGRGYLSLFPPCRIIPYLPCLFGTGHTDASLHFALALLLQVQSPHCYNGWPLLALLPVLLLLSLLLPVAADRRMEKRRASCFVECRIRGKLHSLWPASSLYLSLSLFHRLSMLVISLFLSYILDFTPFLNSKFRIVDRYRVPAKDVHRMMATSMEDTLFRFFLNFPIFSATV